MDAGQIQKLLDANLEQLASRAANPRATLSALGQKIAAAIAHVEGRLGEVDNRAIELPALMDAENEKLKKLDAVIAKAENDQRPDLKQAALGRKAGIAQQLEALVAEGEGLDSESAQLQTMLEQLQSKQVDLDAAIAAAPIDANPAPAPAPAPQAAAAAPKAAAPAPKAAAPAAKKGGDSLDDEFAALLAAENLSLDQIELPKKKAKPVVPESDFSIPDLVMVSDNELPDDATDEDRAPIPTVPAKGAAAKGAPVAKGAPAASPAAAKAAPAAAAKAAPAPAAKAAAVPAKNAAPATTAAAPKSRTWIWVTVGVVALGGGGAAVAHFVYGLF